MMQQPKADDLVIGTGSSHTVRQFAEFCFAEAGIEIAWSGRGVAEVGADRRSGKVRVAVDPAYFRPLEVERLRADARKASQTIGWKARTLAPELAKLMVRYDQTYDDYGFPDQVSDAQIKDRQGKRA
jgi:GDPmannose 4,6-dehydratase